MSFLSAIIIMLPVLFTLAEAVFDLKFVKRIVCAVCFAFPIAYLISPVIPFGTDIDKLATNSFSQTAANSAITFIIAVMIILLIIFVISIFFDKIIEFIMNIYEILIVNAFIFAFIALIQFFEIFSKAISNFLETQEIEYIHSIKDQLIFDPICVIIPFITGVIAIIVFIAAFIKYKKIYEYVTLIYFSALMGCFLSMAIMALSGLELKHISENISEFSTDKDSIMNIFYSFGATLDRLIYPIILFPFSAAVIRSISDHTRKKPITTKDK